MRERRSIGRLSGYAEEVAAAMRRRTEKRRPRVRVRIGHGEARVLDEESPQGVRVQSLCQSILDQERSTMHG